MSTAMDRVLIKDLMLRCVLGLADEERREKQDVLINLILWGDLRRAGTSDDIGDAIDYRELKKQIITLVEDSQYHLAERLAERIAGLCLHHARVQQVQVSVEKPTALRFARSVAVEIVRGRAPS